MEPTLSIAFASAFAARHALPEAHAIKGAVRAYELNLADVLTAMGRLHLSMVTDVAVGLLEFRQTERTFPNCVGAYIMAAEMVGNVVPRAQHVMIDTDVECRVPGFADLRIAANGRMSGKSAKNVTTRDEFLFVYAATFCTPPAAALARVPLAVAAVADKFRARLTGAGIWDESMDSTPASIEKINTSARLNLVVTKHKDAVVVTFRQ
jgi:hypothetical protein